MATLTMIPLTLHYMRPVDVPEVVAIDRASFNPPWPARSYNFEISESTSSYMAVLENAEAEPTQGIRRIFNSLRGNNGAHPVTKRIVGYAGLWKIQEEAHISTIASHPAYRGKGYGEILLAGMVRRALELGAHYIVLEVRVSNTVAQRLYRKYGFEIHGTKPNYYRNDNEDAYDMRLDLRQADVEARIQALYEGILHRRPFIDDFSQSPHPRLG